MIRVILKGGLGNQMFQYATAKSLAIERKTDLILDLTFLHCRPPIPNFTVRNYELGLFAVPEKTTEFIDIPIINKYAYPLQLLTNKLLNKNYIQEPAGTLYSYTPELFDSKDNIVIDGFWNNYKYFERCEIEIKNIFNPLKLYDKKYDNIEKEISTTESVSINIRRGDYLNKKHADIYTYLDTDYYKQAIKIISERVKRPKFFIFSYDDPNWLSENLKLDKNEFVVMDKSYTGDRFKTYLRLISLCKHNIISNSTFAFWGAYLNETQKNIQIGPKTWTHNTFFDYPSGWVVL